MLLPRADNGKYATAMEYGENRKVSGLGTGTLDSWGGARLVTTIVSAGQLFASERAFTVGYVNNGVPGNLFLVSC